MKRLSFHEDGEEHNFWQNYTDLMSGLLIVFIVASIASSIELSKKLEDKNESVERCERVQEFNEYMANICDSSKYFVYNKQYKRLECKIDLQFGGQSFELVPDPLKRDSLLRAGNELKGYIQKYHKDVGGTFKVVIEGRSAKDVQKELEYNFTDSLEARRFSFRRALTVYEFWKQNSCLIPDSIKDAGGEVFLAGSGYEGLGRYESKRDEDRNKTVIIQIIPIIDLGYKDKVPHKEIQTH